MNLTTSDFMALQSVGLDRQKYRQQLITHRRQRSIALGPCMRFQFEDELTIRRQIQEMLHSDRFRPEDMQRQIDICSHLVPDGTDWKATLTFQPTDVPQFQRDRSQLDDAAREIYVELPHHVRVYAEVDADVTAPLPAPASAAHYLRFPFAESWRAALLAGATATLGCGHELYEFRRVIPPATIARLRRDLVLATHAIGSTTSRAATC